MFVLILIYLSFISLGLPDSLLGSAWTAIREELSAPVELAGMLSLIASAGTVISSLASTRLILRFGTAKVTACSVALTALSLFGICQSPAAWLIALLALPLGLGGGAVDSVLNNYVALHYKARHMNWLHCFWGIGASGGPMILSLMLTVGAGWRWGYATVALLQSALAITLFASIPAWRRAERASLAAAGESETAEKPRPIPLREAIRIPKAIPMFAALFSYCALELTAGLWCASYATIRYGTPENTAATFTSVFYFGITLGRAAAGFLSLRFSNPAMIRLGQGVSLLGVLLLLLPLGEIRVPIAFALLGLGCAPIYPAMLHETPHTFGRERSQAMMGIQMASAYCGSTLMPPLFGLIAGHISIALLPFYLAVLLGAMILCTETVRRA